MSNQRLGVLILLWHFSGARMQVLTARTTESVWDGAEKLATMFGTRHSCFLLLVRDDMAVCKKRSLSFTISLWQAPSASNGEGQLCIQLPCDALLFVGIETQCEMKIEGSCLQPSVQRSHYGFSCLL